MAIMLGGAAFHAAEKLKPPASRDWRPKFEDSIAGGDLERGRRLRPRRAAASAQLGRTCDHRPSALPSPATRHRAGARLHARDGGADRRAAADADGRVHMYPCFAFEFHLLLIAIAPDLGGTEVRRGGTEVRRYVVGHDCGTVINPKIVRGMTMGGIPAKLSCPA
jgi:2-furoyl-CoA dehydrogenase large subunit